jgi:hydrogenase maturation protease
MKYDVTEPPLLVIGYGNTLRRDDGAGWIAARRLSKRLPAELASVVMVHQLLPELSEPIARAQHVIFIDASAELAPGDVKRQALYADKTPERTIGHQQSPAKLLRMARDLYGQAPTAMIYSIGGSDFSYGCSLSRTVQIALRKIVREIVHSVLAA